jgi:riboflavin-specific deaminase-like protein
LTSIIKKQNNAVRPFVAVNFALTFDGRISTRNLTPVDFSSKTDKRRLLEIRAKSDALLFGRTTLETENLAMGLPAEDLRAARVRCKQPPYPIRVIVSNTGRINPALKIFQTHFSPVLIYSTSRMPAKTRAVLGKVATLHLSEGRTVDLASMLSHLRSAHKVRRVVCEGGAELFRSLLVAGLVDEINLTFCPHIFGGTKAPTLTGLPGDFLPETTHWQLAKMAVIGEECFLRYRVQHSDPSLRSKTLTSAN